MFLGGAVALIADVQLVRTWKASWAWVAVGAAAAPVLTVGIFAPVVGLGCLELGLLIVLARLSVGAHRLGQYQKVLQRSAPG
jgi:hypothetical protein